MDTGRNDSDIGTVFSAAIRAVEPYHARGQRVGQDDEPDRKPCCPGSNEFCLLR